MKAQGKKKELLIKEEGHAHVRTLYDVARN